MNETRKRFLLRLCSLIFGLFLFALGIVFTLKANIGYAPWEVLHVGLSKLTGLSIGLMSISVGLLIILIVWLLGEKIGLGTVFNMVLIGLFLDFLLFLNIIPLVEGLISGIIMLIIGIIIIAFGSYFYIKSAFGAGPRDSLMVVLARITKLPIGICRGSVELLALLGGWLLGGLVGVGTVIFVVAMGFFVQLVFKIFKFDATKVKHETLNETVKALFGKS